MSDFNPPLVTIAVLDFNRPKEAKTLMDSLRGLAHFRHEIVYVSNGGPQDYVKAFYDAGRIDRLILNRDNCGCGIATRQAIQSCMTPWVMYVQVDQFLRVPFTETHMTRLIERMNANPLYLYADLAGDQGHGSFSERALMIEKKRYLAIPDIDTIIGGPGPWANHKWTEQHVQEYVRKEGLMYLSVMPAPFADNGRISIRSFPCGGETTHFTDVKTLFITKPFTRRYDDFPNLKLSDAEWELVLAGQWPEEGRIPEADLPHSFVHWKE